MAVFRVDATGKLGSLSRTGAGGVSVPVNLARTGIQIYRRPDGTEIRDYRAPEEVFAPESLASLANAPVTVGHPRSGGVPVAVTPANYERLAKGHAASSVSRVTEDAIDWVASELVLATDDVQNRVESGDLCEVSAGYYCDHDETPGVAPNGEKYDRRQIGIRYNHIALLPKGQARAGRDARLRLDGDEELEPPAASNPQPEKHTMKKVTVDGIEYDFGSDSHVAALEKLLAGAKDALAKSESKAGELAAELDTTKTQLADAKNVDVGALVKDELEFRALASKLLGDSYEFDGKDRDAVRREALAKAAPSLKLDGQSEEFVRAAFVIKVDEAQTEKPEHFTKEPVVVDSTPSLDVFASAYKASFKGAN